GGDHVADEGFAGAGVDEFAFEFFDLGGDVEDAFVGDDDGRVVGHLDAGGDAVLVDGGHVHEAEAAAGEDAEGGEAEGGENGKGDVAVAGGDAQGGVVEAIDEDLDAVGDGF